MIGFYVIIALWTWFYVGQPEHVMMLACKTTVADSILVTGEGGGGAAASLAARMF